MFRTLSIGTKVIVVAVIGVLAISAFAIASTIFHVIEIGAVIALGVGALRFARRSQRALRGGSRRQLR